MLWFLGSLSWSSRHFEEAIIAFLPKRTNMMIYVHSITKFSFVWIMIFWMDSNINIRFLLWIFSSKIWQLLWKYFHISTKLNRIRDSNLFSWTIIFEYFSMIYCLPLQISNANNEHFSNVKFIAFYLRVGTKKLILNLIAFAPKNNIFLTSIEIIWYE